MGHRNEFWQRQINDTLVVEVVPGERPRLLIERTGDGALEFEQSEVRPLIEALTIALGELYILKDPQIVAQIKALLEKDVTLVADRGEPRSATPRNPIKEQELLERYRIGERGFSRADLRQANLAEADLRGINLFEADLTEANLQEANLQQANLAYAKLQGANLQGANLANVKLQGTNLIKADLTGAKVTDEQLARVELLTGAILPDGTEHA